MVELSANSDGENDLDARTADFALAAINLAGDLPRNRQADHLGIQMMRAATSVGAHYREAYRARSDAEFTSKLDIALQELEEARYWLELLARANLAERDRLRELYQEASELLAILASIVVRTKRAAED